MSEIARLPSLSPILWNKPFFPSMAILETAPL